jgi:hypothetical protein
MTSLHKSINTSFGSSKCDCMWHLPWLPWLRALLGRRVLHDAIIHANVIDLRQLRCHWHHSLWSKVTFLANAQKIAMLCLQFITCFSNISWVCMKVTCLTDDKLSKVPSSLEAEMWLPYHLACLPNAALIMLSGNITLYNFCGLIRHWF